MKELHYQLDLLKAMNQKLSAKERMYRLICDTVPGAFIYYSFEKNEIATLGKWDEFFDFDIREPKDAQKLFEVVEDEYILPLREVFFPEKKGEVSATTEVLLKDSRIWLRFDVQIICDEGGNPLEKVISIDNVTKMKAQKKELEYMAYYDDLTGLYNRNFFVRLLGDFIRRAEESNSIVSLLIIDIDNFRKVNDGLGIIVGDELVQQFGSFLKEFSDENTIVCHLTSDVYCMAIYDPIGNRSVENIHKQIRRRTKDTFRLSGGQELQISVSIGVAEYPEAAQSALDLINCAEIVMFKGKDMGKNTIQYCNEPVLEDFRLNVEIENKLIDAVLNKSFSLYYQPQFHSGNGKLRGVEALIRWEDTPGHFVSPAVFIPVAEKTGMITPIGNWVVQESVRQYSVWRKKYGVDFMLSINISATQYCQEDFVSKLVSTLEKYQVEPYLVELEITESVLIDDFEMVSKKLQILKEYGVKISLDDFGTGFSSLSYLKKLPIDTLKIDKSFIDTVLSDSTTRVITESIINMVKSLGFESVAEGVEEEQQYKYLHAIGCDTIQGYLLGKPQTPEQIEVLIQKTLYKEK